MLAILRIFLLMVIVCNAARLPKQFYLLQNVYQVDSNHQLPTGYIQSPFHYYATPIYDYGLELRPLYPNLQPGFVHQGPTQLPPQNPLPDDDGIEKLDQKYDPAISGSHKPGNLNNSDDTVTIDAIY